MKNGAIYIKRVYEDSTDEDGFRILVDRLWPRGLKKENAHIDKWLKNIAPSGILRKQFNHDADKWQDFRRSYETELHQNETVKELLEDVMTNKKITLLYGAHDEKHNNAVVLKSFLEKETRK